MRSFVVMLLLFSCHSHASIRLEYRANRVHGLFKFVMAISGESRHPKGLLEHFKRSSYAADPLIQKQLAEFESVKASLFKKIEPKKLVPGRMSHLGVLAAVITQSMFAQNLNDFSQRILNLLPKEDHVVLVETLKKFEPIYDKLLWQKSVAKLSKLESKLEQHGTKINLNAAFHKVSIFYGAKWPAQTPFVVGLYPVPWLKDSKNSTNSQSLGSVVEHGALMGPKEKSAIDDLGVIFHEMAHSLYDAQSFETMSNQYGYFAQSLSKFCYQAYTWFNEALATALDAWITAKATGQGPPKGDWYSDPIIDGFAKVIFPLVTEYLAHDQTIDRSFVEKTIEHFEKRFPEAIYDLTSILNKVYVVHEGSFLQEPAAMKILMQFFYVSSYDGNIPLDDPQSITAFSNPVGRPVVTIFSDREIAKIGQVAKQVPLVGEHLETLRTMKNRSYFTQLDSGARALIFIKVSSPQEYEEALKKLSAIGKLSAKPTVVEF